MSTVLLIGYYGNQNTGDDAFLAVSAWGASNIFGHTSFLANTDRIYKTNELTVKPINMNSKWPWLNSHNAKRKVGQASQVIFGGGSNFHTAKYIDEWCRWIDAIGIGPHCAVGISVGPFREPAAENACARLFSRLAFVGTRDAISYERAIKLQTTAKVALTFDIAPLLMQATGFTPNPQRERKSIGVSLCNYERFVMGDITQEMRRIEAVASAINVVARCGDLREVVLIDFNGHPVLGDHDVHHTLANLLHKDISVRHVPYSPNPLHALEEISSLHGIIAMRLHAGIFAYMTETPAYLLAYHEKCYEWSETVGWPSILIGDADQVNVLKMIEGIHLMLSKNCPPPSCPFVIAQQRAMSNWIWKR